VLPSKATPALPDGTYSAVDGGAENGRAALPGEDLDPVRSPEDPPPAGASTQEQDSSSSSSLSGLDKILPKPDDEQPEGKKRKLKVEEPAHQETAASDIDVGKYYLQIKNWKAAQSRFESAMVLDPQNPEVYWGLAETERHLGKFAEARAHYIQLLDYDPDGPHAKEARRALKDPEIENAASSSTEQPAAVTAK
jgi:tetratricopeptide (TPR) repeat protein